ncbi:MAG: hypothetical protein MI799_02830 [Desulfobacterales bacterium]|nr:hypothetical protein [Desulfobacterales bacterium]
MSFFNMKYFLVTLLFLFHSTSAAHADQENNFLAYDKIENLQKIIDQFDDDKFNAYLIEMSHYCFKDYRIAICNMFVEYRNNLSKVNFCAQKSSELQKDYNGQWVDDLLNLVNREYIINNTDNFKNLFYNINNKQYRYFCIENEKDVVFSEVYYILTMKKFLNLFISYAESVPESERKLYSKKVIIASSIIDSMANPPVQNILNRQLGSYLNIMHNVDLQPNVIEYILNHPTFSKPFDLIKTIGDLNAVINRK